MRGMMASVLSRARAATDQTSGAKGGLGGLVKGERGMLVAWVINKVFISHKGSFYRPKPGLLTQLQEFVQWL
jgi:hypothetical protein